MKIFTCFLILSLVVAAISLSNNSFTVAQEVTSHRYQEKTPDETR